MPFQGLNFSNLSIIQTDLPEIWISHGNKYVFQIVIF